MIKCIVWIVICTIFAITELLRLYNNSGYPVLHATAAVIETIIAAVWFMRLSNMF